MKIRKKTDNKTIYNFLSIIVFETFRLNKYYSDIM